MWELKATTSLEDENNDIVPATSEKPKYELAKDARVASLVYLLKPLQDTTNEL
jgi:replication-associated recombination protein RarA